MDYRREDIQKQWENTSTDAGLPIMGEKTKMEEIFIK